MKVHEKEITLQNRPGPRPENSKVFPSSFIIKLKKGSHVNFAIWNRPAMRPENSKALPNGMLLYRSQLQRKFQFSKSLMLGQTKKIKCVLWTLPVKGHLSFLQVSIYCDWLIDRLLILRFWLHLHWKENRDSKIDLLWRDTHLETILRLIQQLSLYGQLLLPLYYLYFFTPYVGEKIFQKLQLLTSKHKALGEWNTQ